MPFKNQNDGNQLQLETVFLFTLYSWILFVLIIASQNEILPRVYSVTTTASNTTATPNSSSLAGVIIITKNDKGNLSFKPQTLTIKPGEEIFIGNNDTSPHSVTNGISSMIHFLENCLILDLLIQKDMPSL